MSVRRSHSRRHTATSSKFTLDEMRRQVGGDTEPCASIMMAGIGLSMKCVAPCGRCRALEDELARLQPELVAAREKYQADMAAKKPRRAPATDTPYPYTEEDYPNG